MFKKSEYAIAVNKGGEVRIETVKGYCFQMFGINFGVCKAGRQWVVTEIKTGLKALEAPRRKDVITMITPDLCKKIESAYQYSKKYIDLVESRAARQENQLARPTDNSVFGQDLTEKQEDENEKMENALKDKNGNIVAEGCYVKLTGCNVKNDNGIYIVDVDYNTRENAVKSNTYLLHKVNTNGKKSKAKYSLYFLDGKNPQATDSALEIEVVSLENLRKARKEVTEYLKEKTASETVYAFSKTDVETVEDLKKGMVVKIVKPLLLRGHINSFKGSYIVKEVRNGGFSLHLLGKKGGEISRNFNSYTMSENYYQGQPVTLFFKNEVVQQLFDEEYIAIMERNETTKGQLEQQNQTTAESPKEKKTKQEEDAQAEELAIESKPDEEQKAKRTYCPIDEDAARVAKEVNSFSEYRNGSATAEYRRYCDKAYDILDRIRTEKPDQAERAEKKVDYYCRKLAKYYNDYYRNEASCPSVMICGPANFPVKKKNRQNSRRETLHNTWEYLENYLRKIEDILTCEQPIKSGDSDAIEKLTAKIEQLEAEHKLHLDANRYYKKKGTLKGFDGLEEKEMAEIEDFIKRNPFFPPFFTNNETANIRRYKQRLEKLKKEKEAGTVEQTEEDAENNGLFTVVENKEIMRLQILFDGVPPVSARDILKSNGFKWSPKNKAWQRQLTDNARYTYKSIKDNLKDVMSA